MVGDGRWRTIPFVLYSAFESAIDKASEKLEANAETDENR